MSTQRPPQRRIGRLAASLGLIALLSSTLALAETTIEGRINGLCCPRAALMQVPVPCSAPRYEKMRVVVAAVVVVASMPAQGRSQRSTSGMLAACTNRVH
ncbi:MAG: hypothetical protein VBE63_26380, partial [Lamprobacter sp.]|uniref:hypothetical protein n=1 Tax=Lamprobacter sp. TaxID=3100796 RepID=UPI002B25E33A